MPKDLTKTSREKTPEVTKGSEPAPATITMVKVETLTPNPYQPQERLEPTPEFIQKFVISIRQHGLMQVPIGRRIDGKVQVGDGWLRVCAFRKLIADGVPGYDSIPLDLKPLTDQQMADLVLEANTIRQDMSAIAEAKLYKRYIEEFHKTQEELAALHNLSQGEIANRIRLLELPAFIQEAIISQKILATTARHLLRLNAYPDDQKKFFDEIVARPISVNELSNDITSFLYERSKSLKGNDSYDSPVFDMAECQSCPANQKLGSPYNRDKAEPRCIKTECWEKKTAAALEVRKKKRLAELEALAKTEVTKSKDKDKVSLPDKIGKLKVVARDKLNSSECTELTAWDIKVLDNPGECNTCPKRVLRESYNGKDYDTLCIDVKCHRSKQLKKTKDKNKIAREAFARETEKLIQLALNMTPKDTPKVVMALVEAMIEERTGTAREEIAGMFGLTVNKKGTLVMSHLREDLRAKTVDQLLQIGAFTVLAYQRYDRTKLNKAISVLEGKSVEFDQAEKDWRAANCKDCIHANPDYLDISDRPCWSRALDEQGNCTARSVQEKEKAAAATK